MEKVDVMGHVMEMALFANLDGCASGTDLDTRMKLVDEIKNSVLETENLHDSQIQTLEEEAKYHIRKLRFAKRSLMITDKMLSDEEATLVLKYAKEKDLFAVHSIINHKKETKYVLENRIGDEIIISLQDIV